jgi:hypothetical protein
MESKYYTPEIEEFHIGFEYEWNNSNEDDKWRIAVADLENCYHSVQDIQQELNYQHYRIKYLDKEDIESLGWKFYENDTIPLKAFSKNEDYKLTYISGMHRVSIANNLVEHTHFDGSIKNKSELKKLMKQLGIDGTK